MSPQGYSSRLLNAILFVPFAPWPADDPVEDQGSSKRPPALVQACQHPVGRAAIAGYRTRLYVPRTYWMALIGLIGAYLGAIFQMDAIACDGTETCKNYSKLEWAFSQSAAMEVLDAWTAKGRAAMALSAGLHIFSSFLFAQLFIVGGTGLREFFSFQNKPRLTTLFSLVPYLGRVFNVFYCVVHCLNASTVVSSSPNAATPVVVGVFLIIALILLIVCALTIIVGGVYALVAQCVASRRAAEGDVALTAQSPHDSAAPVTAVVVVPYQNI